MRSLRNAKPGGVDRLRTMAGRDTTGEQTPYRVYMKIAALELQRHRLMSERGNALQRVAVLEAKIRELEGEQAVVLQAMDDKKSRLSRKDVSEAAARIELGESPQRPNGGFKFKY